MNYNNLRNRTKQLLILSSRKIMWPFISKTHLFYYITFLNELYCVLNVFNMILTVWIQPQGLVTLYFYFILITLILKNTINTQGVNLRANFSILRFSVASFYLFPWWILTFYLSIKRWMTIVFLYVQTA